MNFLIRPTRSEFGDPEPVRRELAHAAVGDDRIDHAQTTLQQPASFEDRVLLVSTMRRVDIVTLAKGSCNWRDRRCTTLNAVLERSAAKVACCVLPGPRSRKGARLPNWRGKVSITKTNHQYAVVLPIALPAQLLV